MEQCTAVLSCQDVRKLWRKQYLERSGGKGLPRDLSPFRYPGGKGSLKYFLANTVHENFPNGANFVEPFCGGAGASIPLLESGVIDELWLNDANPAVSSFWENVFFNTDALLDLINTTPVTIEQWHIWKDVINNPSESSMLELGFAAFFMNRCNRSGLLNGGPIGGLEQLGKYKIDCRYNRYELMERINVIAKHRDKVRVFNLDACDFMESLSDDVLTSSFIFIDPPYVSQGKSIYKEFSFAEDEHRRLSEYIKQKDWCWLITYDEHPLIHSIYSDRDIGALEFSYIMQQAKIGRELLVTSSLCNVILPSTGNLVCENK